MKVTKEMSELLSGRPFLQELYDALVRLAPNHPNRISKVMRLLRGIYLESDLLKRFDLTVDELQRRCILAHETAQLFRDALDEYKRRSR